MQKKKAFGFRAKRAKEKASPLRAPCAKEKAFGLGAPCEKEPRAVERVALEQRVQKKKATGFRAAHAK